LKGFDCIVPNGIDAGHTFYVHARDASGQEVAVPGAISQQRFCLRRTTDFSIRQADGNGACAKTDPDAEDLAVFNFSRIATEEMVTLVIFGKLPEGLSVNDPQRSSFQDVGKGLIDESATRFSSSGTYLRPDAHSGGIGTRRSANEQRR
jgi:hypothetical protein